MKQILVYGDSLSWGVIPGTRKRFDFTDRWPGVVERQLRRAGHDVRVIEDCLNGRRTSWDDPSKPGRNGLIGLQQRIEINSPLSLVMIMLGTNDFQTVHQVDARGSAEGVRSLVTAIRRAPIEPGMPTPSILLIAPPQTRVVDNQIAAKFRGAEAKANGFTDAIRQVATDTRSDFFDASNVTESSEIDGVHLDQSQQRTLGRALAAAVRMILAQADAHAPSGSDSNPGGQRRKGGTGSELDHFTNEVASKIERIVDHWEGPLLDLESEVAHDKPSVDRWSVSEVIGHLVDSACNNHQRFVRAQGVETLRFPKYEQNDWVVAADYRRCNWFSLVTLWRTYNVMLAQLIRGIPQAALKTPCTITPYDVCTLEFLLTDYVVHLEHHLSNLSERLAEHVAVSLR